MMTTICTCRRSRARGRYCCAAAELAALRHTFDTAIRDLDGELKAPRAIDDDGVLRLTVTGAVKRMREVRSGAAA